MGVSKRKELSRRVLGKSARTTAFALGKPPRNDRNGGKRWGFSDPSGNRGRLWDKSINSLLPHVRKLDRRTFNMDMTKLLGKVRYGETGVIGHSGMNQDMNGKDTRIVHDDPKPLVDRKQTKQGNATLPMRDLIAKSSDRPATTSAVGESTSGGMTRGANGYTQPGTTGAAAAGKMTMYDPKAEMAMNRVITGLR